MNIREWRLPLLPGWHLPSLSRLPSHKFATSPALAGLVLFQAFVALLIALFSTLPTTNNEIMTFFIKWRVIILFCCFLCCFVALRLCFSFFSFCVVLYLYLCASLPFLSVLFCISTLFCVGPLFCISTFVLLFLFFLLLVSLFLFLCYTFSLYGSFNLISNSRNVFKEIKSLVKIHQT